MIARFVDGVRRTRRRLAEQFTRKITTQRPNSAIVADDWSDVLMGCCDCGLMHRYAFTVDERKRLVIRARRDTLATIVMRESRAFPFGPEKATDRQAS